MSTASAAKSTTNGRPEIVITGLGVVSPIGIGSEPYGQSMAEQRSGVRNMTLFDTSQLPVRFGGEIPDFEPKKHVRPRKSLKIMCREIQLGFAAAAMSYEMAGLDENAVDRERLGCVFGAEMMYTDLAELTSAYRACLENDNFDFRRWGAAAMGEMYPLWMLKYLPNMPACHIGIYHDARGPNNTITLGEVSSLLAIAEAVRTIENGRADVMFAGGASSRILPTIWVFRDNRYLSHRHDDPAGACRPFDAMRDGPVNGEGACSLILERREHAEARGAKILARIQSYSSCIEPRTNRRNPITGTGIRESIRTALAQADIAPEDIGHVNAHGLSAIDHDQVEALRIREALGDVPVTAPKSYFGNLGAASGAVELAASILAFEHGEIPVTLNYTQPDPTCPINIVHGTPAPLATPRALALNQSEMGQAAALLIDRA
ncbi:MAG: beta-ketoacyl-[acyl-carrier-protein] synthase family protein [Pirellulales bacterium]|nr:beta-ketoacyl-[acyl-carrier-protein] synthase family protein [Pirellulales bacterium]